jgi:hypothetical protein
MCSCVLPIILVLLLFLMLVLPVRVIILSTRHQRFLAS